MVALDVEDSCSIRGSGEEVTTRELDRENEALVCNAIKSHKNVKRAMKMLSLPSEFWKLYITCFVLFAATVGIAITEHVVYSQVFEELRGQVDTIAHQSEEYRCVCEANSIVLQMASVTEYSLRVLTFFARGILSSQRAYPSKASNWAMFNWTKDHIKTLTFDLIDLVNSAENTNNAKLIDQNYLTLQNFYYNVTNVWLYNISYAAAFSLVWPTN